MRPPLNTKLFLYAAVAVFIVHSIWLVLMSRLILWPLFDPAASSAPVPANIWTMRLWTYLGRAIFCLAFVLIFTRGYEGKTGVGEGVRYGLLVGVMMILPSFFMNFALAVPPPTGYIVTRCIFEMIGAIVLGVLTNMMYRPREIKSGT
jgi:uncharacterized membrane protein YoaT (DUF817 family)